uniref:CSON011281 protein n=1 Tax=Culicoides sonorensis TaxID=179676 RepID=A0A336K4S2_CULSO
MVCVPCFIVPVLLIIWKKFLEPYVLPIFYKYVYGIEYKKDEKKELFDCNGGTCIFAGKKKNEELSSKHDENTVCDEQMKSDTKKESENSR